MARQVKGCCVQLALEIDFESLAELTGISERTIRSAWGGETLTELLKETCSLPELIELSGNTELEATVGYY